MVRPRRSRSRTLSAFLSTSIPLVVCALVPGASLAAGGGPDGGSVGFSKGHTTPGQQAISEYRTGEKSLDRAREIQLEIAESRESGDAGKIAKLERKAESEYERAAKSFREAIEYDASLFQAWSSLGYALRHLGRFDEALEAYDRAIALEPRYAEAVEYRAEAYLELGRLDEAKQGYEALIGWVRPLAEQLMAKMEAWVELHAAHPGNVEPEQVVGFAAWIDARKASDGEFKAFSAADRAAW